MELLTIKHQDFEMIVECVKFDDIWHKAKSNIGEECLHSTYSWSEGVSSVVLSNYVGKEIVIEKNQQAPAIFFDNVDYPVWVEFKDYVKKAQFGSVLRSENEKFTFRRQVLAGFLNYGNEVGRSEIQFMYQVGAETRSFVFSFEVLSTKLNYHEHWKTIMEDIEREYRMLSLDYMRRTFHGSSLDADGDTPEIVWWSVFASEQKNFIKACKNIIDRPRRRLHGKETYKRADKLTFVPSCIENELAEHRQNSSHLYRVEERVWTNDTQENRFLKFALGQIADKYETLKKRIEAVKNASDVMKEDMQATLVTLKHLKRNPFFRTVGRYKGMNQESLVLQKAMGYSQVYRTWNLLRRSFSLNDGIYRLQTKDIATLYEIWCFIEVSHIVKEKLHLSDEDLEHRNRVEMNGLFTWNLGKGEHSSILFKKDGMELAELIYNPKSSEKENCAIGIKNWTTPTVSQKPDIVLQLTKNDLQQGMKITYLFDAKYRIGGKDKKGVDVPPEDAINQMHRYRDAICYKDCQSDALKKEVIGGYILFPGNGETEDVEASRFYGSIKDVNIGAFPLRPKDKHNRKLLEQFIEQLIAMKSQETVSRVIPQKGVFVEVDNRVLIGLVTHSGREGYLQSFIDGNASLYYTDSHFPTAIALQGLHYFMPYFKEQGIRDVYEIISMKIITAKEAEQTDGEDGTDDLCLAFGLRFVRRQYAELHPVNTSLMLNNTFIDTTFDELSEIVLS
ncbi:MAG: restriction endonuclease-like protein [Prevotellaceae bacterium]|nr:restriction endonuclease-like protein [Prevotellaceae bacterium]